MQLVEQHVIDKNDPRYAIIDAAAFAAKNLYNLALYEWLTLMIAFTPELCGGLPSGEAL